MDKKPLCRIMTSHIVDKLRGQIWPDMLLALGGGVSPVKGASCGSTETSVATSSRSLANKSLSSLCLL